MARRRFQSPRPYKVGKTNRWEITYRTDVVGDDGVVRRIKKVETLGYYPEMTEKQAKRAAALIVEPLNAPSYMPSRIAPFRVIAERYQQTVMPQLKPSTRSSYKSNIVAHLLPAFGDVQMHNFTPEMIQSWIAAQPSDLSGGTIKNVITTFRAVWKTAVAWGYATEKPLDKIVLRSPDRAEGRCATEEEVYKVLMASEEPYRTFYKLAGEAGPRAGELCGLRFLDIDSENAVVSIRQSSWNGKITSPKSKRGIRSFPISAALCKDLMELRHRRATKVRDSGKRVKFWVQWIYDPGYTASEDSFVFATSKGTPWNQGMVLKRHLHPLQDRLGIPSFGLHAFRHYAATQLDRKQASTAVMKSRLGHSSFTTTERYIHLVS